jgi:DNA-binding NarL/FixJ family response regulator
VQVGLVSPSSFGTELVCDALAAAIERAVRIRWHLPAVPRRLVVAPVDLVILDLGLPTAQLFDAVVRLRRLTSSPPLLLASSSAALEQPSGAHRALLGVRAGAAGVVVVDGPPAMVRCVVQAALERCACLPPTLHRRLVPPENTARAIALSPELRRVWQLLLTGADGPTLALRLHVSERTAKRRIAALLQALGVADRLQAARLAGELQAGRWSG